GVSERQFPGIGLALRTLDALPEVVVASQVPVLLDGGVRRGTDALKAVCQGAKAVLIGHPYLWALAVGGKEGVLALIPLPATDGRRTT
ncbi:MAG TPA: hypothetical protein DEV93_00840, partial [Chloroflexi bacterium]|nr:hypothetical protein [Chloroflexota bacterium]